MTDVVARVAGLSQGYPSRQVITGMSLTVRVGVLGLLGPNGAGKTTLLRTLATIAPPQGGTLTIDGRRIRRDSDARWARRSIGYLPQDMQFVPSFTVEDFVRYCGWLRRIPDREAAAAAEVVLARLGLTELRRRKLRTLSGGMRQRCGIAQAMLAGPRLLLLDEPTVGLDPEQRLEFREAVRTLPSSAVVMSTHLVEEIANLCDRVAVINAGKITFTGTPAALADAAPKASRGDTPLERGYLWALDRAGGRV